MGHTFFPMVDYWWFYLVFVVFVLALLLLDLGIFHKKPHAITFKEAAIWSVVWVSLALIFNVGFYLYTSDKFAAIPDFISRFGSTPDGAAKQLSLEFLTGFLIEKSLAVDNIFIFALVFQFFAIPSALQHRVLFYGILGALIFRGIFIAIGASLMQYYWVVMIFGAFLILTGVKMMIKKGEQQDPEKNFVVRLTRKLIPVTSGLRGGRFFVRENGILHATPLFLGLIFLEFSDLIFAIDSVPAIFAVTNEPFLVFTSNIFAILGLRSMYFMLVGVLDKFEYLRYGLAAILIFVGSKMTWLNTLYGGHFPTGLSLGIIATILVTTMVASFWVQSRRERLARLVLDK